MLFVTGEYCFVSVVGVRKGTHRERECWYRGEIYCVREWDLMKNCGIKKKGRCWHASELSCCPAVWREKWAGDGTWGMTKTFETVRGHCIHSDAIDYPTSTFRLLHGEKKRSPTRQGVKESKSGVNMIDYCTYCWKIIYQDSSHSLPLDLKTLEPSRKGSDF